MTSEQQSKVKELLDLEDGLTEWEVEFLDNIHTSWWNRDLSVKQEETLDRIHERMFP